MTAPDRLTADRPLRVGVIGVGWAGQQHVLGYTWLPDVEVVAVAGQEDALVESVADTYGIPLVLRDWQDLLALPDVDAVSVATPTFLHAPIAIAALDRGIHVLSEKPIARNGSEGRTMVDAARRAGRVLDVAFNHRQRGDVQALAGILRRGEIGTPYYARASWLRRRGIPTIGSWFTSREMAGGGPLVDIGVHVLDYALYLLGEPEVLSVTAVSYSELGHRGIGGSDRETADTRTSSAFEVEDFAAAFLRLSTGATLLLESSWAGFRDPIDLLDFSVLATDGGADLRAVGASKTPRADLRVYTDIDGEMADYSPEVPLGRGHTAVVENFISTVRTPAEWSSHDGSVALARAIVIDACYRSAREQREVVLDPDA
jgi:predicted dehydrogenase